MTPTIGWTMTVVALIAITALWMSMRRSKRPLPNTSGFKPVMREEVNVVVKKCDEKNFSVEIDPSEVAIKPGRPLRWDFKGPEGATLTIEPKDQGNWPFPGLPMPARAKPTVPVQAGKANGTPGIRYKYWVVIECGDRTFNIDPDIYIYT